MWLIFLLVMLIVVAAVVYISYKNSVDKLKRDNPGVTDEDIKKQEQARLQNISDVIKEGR